MEGFLHMRLPQWFIRLATRLFALLPVMIVAILFGSSGKNLGSVIGLFAGLSFNRSSVFNLPFDLSHFETISDGRIYQCPMEYHPWLYCFHYLDHPQCEIAI